MAVGSLVLSQPYKELVDCADNTAVGTVRVSYSRSRALHIGAVYLLPNLRTAPAPTLV